MRRHLQQVNEKVRKRLGPDFQQEDHDRDEQTTPYVESELKDGSLTIVSNVCREWKEEDVDLISVTTCGEDEKHVNEMRDQDCNDGRKQEGMESDDNSSLVNSCEEKGDCADQEENVKTKRYSWFHTDYNDTDGKDLTNESTERLYTIGNISSIHNPRSFCPITNDTSIGKTEKYIQSKQPIYVPGDYNENIDHIGNSHEIASVREIEKLNLSSNSSGAFHKVVSHNNNEIGEVFDSTGTATYNEHNETVINTASQSPTFLIVPNNYIPTSIHSDIIPDYPNLHHNRSQWRCRLSDHFIRIKAEHKPDTFENDDSYTKQTSQKCNELYEKTRGSMGSAMIQRVTDEKISCRNRNGKINYYFEFFWAKHQSTTIFKLKPPAYL